MTTITETVPTTTETAPIKREVQNILTVDEVVEYKKSIRIEDASTIKKDHKSRLTGYNLYSSIVSIVLKSKIANSDRLPIIGQLWRSLTAEEKTAWNEKAKEIIGGTVQKIATVSKTSTHRLTGYNLYVREVYHSDEMNQIADQKEKMKALGASWKSLNKDKQDEYKTRAKETN